MIFQTQTILSNRIHSMKYQRYTDVKQKMRFCGKNSFPYFQIRVVKIVPEKFLKNLRKSGNQFYFIALSMN